MRGIVAPRCIDARHPGAYWDSKHVSHILAIEFRLEIAGFLTSLCDDLFKKRQNFLKKEKLDESFL